MVKDNLYGLIGQKLSHSISPIVHKEILKRMNINGKYELYEIEPCNLKDFIEECKISGIKGLNVTIPYKISSIDYIDELSEEAKRIGSINTILFDGEKAIGYNTDYQGFSLMLDKYNLKVEGKNALILGTGGVVRAVLCSLIDKGIKNIYVASRDVKVGLSQKWPDCVEIISYDLLPNIKDVEYIINCTPCGMAPNIEACPVNKDLIKNFSVAIDLIYNPSKTLFLSYAEQYGLKIYNGLYMLIAQGVISQEIWNGISVDKKQIDIIFEIVKNNLSL
ncbi:shikimate dehydrogenase [Caloramator sp. E03]|uniref:shikimate dehydrogenase n=1 Tax=Caloramator sp. E03 TaxID=2576307 RepID=UPI001110319F|nr:shikimate dehydrogenase [Caloramator sp. E03]QCX32722.1 shikimate dehydrogenase [Caloramator sp. E03]